jgi:hypothetical protein
VISAGKGHDGKHYEPGENQSAKAVYSNQKNLTQKNKRNDLAEPPLILFRSLFLASDRVASDLFACVPVTSDPVAVHGEPGHHLQELTDYQHQGPDRYVLASKHACLRLVRA